MSILKQYHWVVSRICTIKKDGSTSAYGTPTEVENSNNAEVNPLNVYLPEVSTTNSNNNINSEDISKEDYTNKSINNLIAEEPIINDIE